MATPSQPRIFGRDPALFLSLAATGIRMIAAFWIDLSDNQQAALNATVAAIVGFAIAVIVHDGQVAAILGVVQAVLSLAVGFGLHMDADNQALIMSFTGTVIAMYIRTQVTAPVPPAVVRS